MPSFASNALPLNSLLYRTELISIFDPKSPQLEVTICPYRATDGFDQGEDMRHGRARQWAFVFPGHQNQWLNSGTHKLNEIKCLFTERGYKMCNCR